MKYSMKKSLLILVFVCMLVLSMTLAAADTTVVANSKDWKSIYLISVYADVIDADFVIIKNLGDAELKTSLLDPDDQILIFESTSTPVVKKYRSFLTVNGFNNIGEYTFVDAFELQEYLYDDLNPDGMILLGTDFGMEAIAAAPYALEKNYFPFFYDENNYRYIFRTSRRDDIVAVGRVPYHAVERLRPEEILIGNPQEATIGITRLAVG